MAGEALTLLFPDQRISESCRLHNKPQRAENKKKKKLPLDPQHQPVDT